jgi:glycosyltransferase involved in cell wall biosynthesis
MGLAKRYRGVLRERPWLLRHYRGLLLAYPFLVRAARLPEADVLVTSSYAFANAFRTANNAPQLCYCYSPLRFAWMMTDEYGRQLGMGSPGARAIRAVAAPMRWLDRRAASRVTLYVAESQFVADQIRRFYGFDCEVLHPPVDTERFRPRASGTHDGYYLFCGRLVEPYKRPTLAVEAFRGLPERLLIAGDGPALKELRRIAPPNVEFLGHVDDEDLVPLMQRCAGAIFPSRDDFGLIPIEVAACGRPSLAYGAGGALETVLPGVTGELFQNQDLHTLREAIRKFDPDAYSPDRIREHAEGWSAHRFVARMRELAEGLANGSRA